MTAKEAKKRKLTPLARIASWATVGVDPKSWDLARSRFAQGAEKAGWRPRTST
jgi:acetyl-CoA C-acetyltransferase